MDHFGNIIRNRKPFFKIIVLGDKNVGKTYLIKRILNKNSIIERQTIEAEFGEKEISGIDPDNPNISITLQIWDTCNFYLIISRSRAL
jgi:GTPase SAR1 family protein